MKTWVVLLRGINVGGRNVLKMAELRTLLKEIGCKDVKTYIQSGNCVLNSNITDATKLSSHIAATIKTKFDYDVPAFALTAENMTRAINNNPYPVEEVAQKTVHLFFLSEPALNANIEQLESLRDATENYELLDDVFYLHAPNGIGHSKLAAKAEKCLGVSITARNLRSVNKILALTEKE